MFSGVLRQAAILLDEALPDHVYLPFAGHGDALLPLLEQLEMLPKYKGVEELTAFCARYTKEAKAIFISLDKGNSILNPCEIASEFSISANTAKTLLKNVCRKLGATQ